MSTQELRYSAALSREQAAAALEELAAALRTGPVSVGAGDREVVIAPREVIGLELEVSRKGDKGKLELELRWREFSEPGGAHGLRFTPVLPGGAEQDGDGDKGDDAEATPTAAKDAGDAEKGEDAPDGDAADAVSDEASGS